MNSYNNKFGSSIQSGQSISKGGEGEVFNLVGNPSLCLKIYHKAHRTKEREEKLKYMCANPPSDLEGGNFRICWPKEVVYKNDEFVGFTMLMAFDNSQLPYHLCQPQLPKNLTREWTLSYDRASSKGMMSRLMLCTNIIAAVLRVIKLNKYHLVDLKPQNLLVTSSGKVSLIDLDSVQISDGKTILFKAPVSTPEYTPPEAKEILKKDIPITNDWDSFSVGILVYEILCGLHPYVGTAKPPYENLTTLTDKISNNLTHITKGKQLFANLPSPHNTFDLFSNSLKTIFKKLFADYRLGVSIRPTLEEFGSVLFKEVELYKKNQKEIEQKKAVQDYNRIRIENQNFKSHIKGRDNAITELQDKNNKLNVEIKKLKEKPDLGVWLIILIVIIAVGGAIAFSKVSDLETDLNVKRLRIDELEKVNSSLESSNLQLKESNTTFKYNNGLQKTEISRLKAEVIKLKKTNPLISISEIKMKSTKNSYEYIGYGERLTKSRCYFLKPRIKYWSYSTKSQLVKMRCYDPDGNLFHTSEDNYYIYSGNNSLEIEAFGYSNSSDWESGWYKIDIYIDDKLVGTDKFYITY